MWFDRIVQAQKAGEVRPDADPDAIIEMLFGAMYLRLLLHTRPLEPHQIDDALDVAPGTTPSSVRRVGASLRAPLCLETSSRGTWSACCRPVRTVDITAVTAAATPTSPGHTTSSGSDPQARAVPARASRRSHSPGRSRTVISTRARARRG